MFTQRLPLLLILCGTLLLNACRKNYSDELYTAPVPPVTPDLTVKVITSVAGFVNDEANKPVAGATVNAGNKQATTDEFGYFKIADVSLPETAGFVKVTRNGYFTGYKTFISRVGKENFIRMSMMTKTTAGSFSAAAGGSASTADGAIVQLPANAVVVASTGVAYSGQVNVSARLIDVASLNNFQAMTPGDGRGINTEGHLEALKSFSCIAVELNGSSGEKLQVANGAKATITLPVPAALRSSAPATISAWSFDETNGLWKAEGQLQKSGNNYTGTVSHFSFWEGALGLPLVNFSAQVVNSALQPLANVPVLISYANMPPNAGHGRFGYTDANGNITGAIPANASLVLEVLTTCAIPAYAHTFSTNTSNIDLGTLAANMGQGMVTISGTVTNCSGQPVTDGYIQTYDNGFYNRIIIANGSFSFSGLACTNTTTKYVAIDNSTNQQNAPQSVNLVTGVNNLGNIVACGTSTVSIITYTIDGVTRELKNPGQEPAAFFGSPDWTTIADISVTPSPTMTFQFDGGQMTGTNHKVTDIWSAGYPSGRAYAPVPLTVTITEYGASGGFIAGSFSGMVLDFATNSIHNVNYNFRVKRYN